MAFFGKKKLSPLSLDEHYNPLTLSWKVSPGHYWVLVLELFTFWLVLTRHWSLANAVLGAAVAIVVGVFTHPLFFLPPRLAPEGRRAGMLTPWPKLFRYFPWLFKEIVVSNFQIAALVLHPKLPIAPCLIRFKAGLPHAFAKATLANSITLTPGTITVDVAGDEYLVHALTPEIAEGVRPDVPGSMTRRVMQIYARKGSKA